MLNCSKSQWLITWYLLWEIWNRQQNKSMIYHPAVFRATHCWLMCNLLTNYWCNLYRRWLSLVTAQRRYFCLGMFLDEDRSILSAVLETPCFVVAARGHAEMWAWGLQEAASTSSEKLQRRKGRDSETDWCKKCHNTITASERRM